MAKLSEAITASPRQPEDTCLNRLVCSVRVAAERRLAPLPLKELMGDAHLEDTQLNCVFK